jgi:hypothetical protein
VHPEAQVEAFLAEYDLAIAELGRTLRSRLQAMFPDAVELVYDNYNGLVFGFGPSPKPSEAPLSLQLVPRWVNLCFIREAATLPDPCGLLLGSGRIARHIPMRTLEDFDRPEVQDLIRIAAERAGLTTARTGAGGELIIRSISAKRRPRRPG